MKDCTYVILLSLNIPYSGKFGSNHVSQEWIDKDFGEKSLANE